MVDVDVVVLGLGTSGEDLALQLLDAGLEVAGVESGLLGGECPYWACIPSKAMIRLANLVQEARRMNGLAGVAEVVPDWSLVANRVRNDITGNWDDSYAAERFASRGGVLFRGYGRLAGPFAVEVNGEVITARLGVVLATGSSSFIPPIPGLSDVDYWTTHEAIATERLPQSLVIIGGGAVGCELGQVFTRFGASVTIVEESDRPLAHEEPEASEVIRSVLESEGISIVCGERAASVSDHPDGVEIRTVAGMSLTAEHLLLATGRSVDLTGLGLESVGLDGSARFVETDDLMKAADGLWAMGDLSGRPMFTHVGLHQAGVIADQLLGRNPSPMSFNAVPRVTFTDPEVAAVGLTEVEAREQGVDVAVAVKRVPSTFRGWLHTVGNDGIVKLIIDKRRRTLVGATVVGPTAGEVIGLLSLAVHEETSIDRLREMTYAFPTFHGAVGEALGAYGRGSGTVIDPTFKDSGFLD